MRRAGREMVACAEALFCQPVAPVCTACRSERVLRAQKGQASQAWRLRRDLGAPFCGQVFLADRGLAVDVSPLSQTCDAHRPLMLPG